jgi:leucyl/phenylalanyl-tRNA--protein transferase
MADEFGDIRWFSPDPRAIIELDQCNPSRSLRSVIRRKKFEVRVDSAFERVMSACADRPDGTWISEEILRAYVDLHQIGFAHSVESWQGDELVGGLYGVAIGGAFFGESMFHRVTDASKVALIHMVEHMRNRGMILLDIQFMTDHLQQFGAIEIQHREYLHRLQAAIELDCSFAGAGTLPKAS